MGRGAGEAERAPVGAGVVGAGGAREAAGVRHDARPRGAAQGDEPQECQGIAPAMARLPRGAREGPRGRRAQHAAPQARGRRDRPRAEAARGHPAAPPPAGPAAEAKHARPRFLT